MKGGRQKQQEEGRLGALDKVEATTYVHHGRQGECERRAGGDQRERARDQR